MIYFILGCITTFILINTISYIIFRVKYQKEILEEEVYNSVKEFRKDNKEFKK